MPYFDHTFIKAFPEDRQNPWSRPIRHQKDSMVFEMPMAWSLGKFVASKVPPPWKDMNNPNHDSFTAHITRTINYRYLGVVFITIGCAVINPNTRECYLVKNILHDDWDPSPLPQPGETPLTYHKRLVGICNEWKKAKKPKKRGHIQIRPVSTVVMERIIVDQWSPSMKFIKGHMEIPQSQANPRLFPLLFCEAEIFFHLHCYTFTQKKNST